MYRVGITGQTGFIGTHISNTLKIVREKYVLIPFHDEYFTSKGKLEEFVSQCDIIIHLAALNRHNDSNIIYSTNISLINKLIYAMESTHSLPHVLFASSIQEDLDNRYGQSKLEGRLLFEKWAEKNNSRFTGLIIPNVYGPFGAPYYNSVISTFCFQLTHNEKPKIDIDCKLKLIYVGELVDRITQLFETKSDNNNDYLNNRIIKIPHTVETKVSEILKHLESFQKDYYTNGIIPNLNDKFIRNLFNTFVCYIDHKNWFPIKYITYADNRGSFSEMIKFHCGGQVSFSTTKPGITRGNHFHTRKAERFIVIKGKAKIEIRRIGTNEKQVFYLKGSEPSFVDMPIWHTHNITNIGSEELLTLFWINEFYNPNNPDTFFEEV